MSGIQELLGISVGFFAIFATFAFLVWVVWCDYRKTRLRYEERRALIERGITPPPVNGEQRARGADRPLRSGITIVAIGIGFWLIALLAGEGAFRAFASIGSFVGVIGLGNIAYWLATRKRAGG